MGWAAAVTFIIVKVGQALVGLRVSADDETEGLGHTAHGETGCNY